MAVFTELTDDEVRAFVAHLHVGELRRCAGIQAGIENTNYFVDTRPGGVAAWVLTLFERLTHEQLPFYLRLMQHLARHGMPVPEPRADADGALVHTLRGKPAALCHRLPGGHQSAPERAPLRAGRPRMLALHAGAVGLRDATQPNLRGLAWWLATAPQVRPLPRRRCSRAARRRDRIPAAAGGVGRLPGCRAPRCMPTCSATTCCSTGAEGHEHLSGCVDFYFAGVDTLLFDLAVCVNDWCMADESGRIDDDARRRAARRLRSAARR